MSVYIYETSKGKKRYRAVVWRNNQRFKTRTFNKKIDAQEWYDRTMHKLLDGKIDRLKGNSVTLDEFFHNVYWPNKPVREGTAIDYKRIYTKHLKDRLGKKKLINLKEESWASVINDLRNKGMSDARANRVHAAASAIMTLAKKWKYVAENPLNYLPWYKEDIGKFDYWSFEESEKFLMWTAYNSPRFPIYHTAYELGLRMEEIVALKKCAINFNQMQIHIREAYCKATKKFLRLTKSGHERILAISDGLANSLRRVSKDSRCDFIFTRNNGEKPLTHDYLRYHFKDDQLKAEVRRITFHSIRHTFASHYMMRGGNIYELKDLLGHADIKTSQRYAHLSPEHLRRQSSLVNFEVPVRDNIVKLKREKISAQPTSAHNPHILSK